MMCMCMCMHMEIKKLGTVFNEDCVRSNIKNKFLFFYLTKRKNETDIYTKHGSNIYAENLETDLKQTYTSNMGLIYMLQIDFPKT